MLGRILMNLGNAGFGWEKINNRHEYPSENRPIDMLITHGPAHGILDLNLGCKILKKFILKQKPVYHIFGHIHETGGNVKKFGLSTCINVCSKFSIISDI